MTSFPYALAALSDHLRAAEVTQELRRFDEQSGSGDGRVWAQELARPLWQVSLKLVPCETLEARRVDALLRALRGSQESFLWADPSYAPSYDPGDLVVVSAISSDRSTVNFTGLPPHYPIRPGDRFSIEWGGGRQYLAEVAEETIASNTGMASAVAVYPYVPLGIAPGASANFLRPVMRAFVPPGGHTPFTALPGGISSGGALQLLQRI
ncbi:hypothetical protein [Falsigemmobacter faecalis]|uniref:Uncharacterized protein n=1 Tax=Falsigemmobacter faecalis TaxID=2488730 RepID=A0A3P3D942_9RHOB|nr:hypothetical protein [Falsigemmobacter faecalis]RRH69962.1 hypothetical protein EG244_17755 [Falsigemmobacter faecalis]